MQLGKKDGVLNVKAWVESNPQIKQSSPDYEKQPN